MSVVTFAALVLLMLMAGSAGVGLFYALLLRSFHEKPSRVGFGAAFWFFLFAVFCIIPANFLTEGGDTLSVFVAMTPGWMVLLAMEHFKFYRRLPFLGGPMADFRLAWMRREEHPFKREQELIAKLEAERGYVFPRK